MTAMGTWTVHPGRPFPLGAVFDGDGANFALFSDHAEKVELCLFSKDGKKEIARIPLPECTRSVWHGYLPKARPGLLYGYRVYGPYAPRRGHRFNANKLLADPYARALSGPLINNEANFGFKFDSHMDDTTFDERDNALYMPKGVLTGNASRDGSPLLRTPWEKTIIYELHVVGMTRRHPDVAGGLRGTFAGLTSDEVLRHLQDLGITAVELLPVFPFADEPHLTARGLRNYWGYNPYNFFAPEPRYAGRDAIAEFRAMAARFHGAGIEVLLDVVFNHTGEGGHQGPTLSLKGIDNLSYYRLIPGDERRYVDDTGCGNTLNMSHPRVLQLVMDSLRYWVGMMDVDGFRFDLASILARNEKGFDPNAAFFAAVDQDPVLAGVKMIAEPWDIGPGGYRLGGFPPGWAEWNDRYRNTLRAFWRGDEGIIGELAKRLSGSSDLFGARGRGPHASINYITAHDGFRLHDLVSYNEKHNDANLEEGRDGNNNNLSWNCGIEGPTRNLAVRRLRQKQKRNLIASLFLSQGVPMMLGGDELGATQSGNNNAYCQDSKISWIDWERVDDDDRLFLEFVKKMIALRNTYPALQCTSFFSGEKPAGKATNDITWWLPEGREFVEMDWNLPHLHCCGFHLAGAGKREPENLMLLLNANDEEAPFLLPPGAYARSWRRLVDTGFEDGLGKPGDDIAAGSVYPLKARSLVVLAQNILLSGMTSGSGR